MARGQSTQSGLREVAEPLLRGLESQERPVCESQTERRGVAYARAQLILTAHRSTKHPDAPSGGDAGVLYDVMVYCWGFDACPGSRQRWVRCRHGRNSPNNEKKQCTEQSFWGVNYYVSHRLFRQAAERLGTGHAQCYADQVKQKKHSAANRWM